MKPISVLTAIIFFILSPSAFAGEDPIYTGVFSNKAAGGYDVVAYFTEGKPVKGEKVYQTSYMGAEWRFASMAHKEAFEADPARYAPQYGGYCAWAMARGYTASGDPKEWRIVDGKLYLNYDADIKAKWEKDIPGFIAKANVNFPNLVDLEDE
ncbi:MAG: YHS domain-containing protein [Alphaproteobacteria bacterium]|nr:YHS domain-containing protein [Alphaproteobacteria bacterium]